MRLAGPELVSAAIGWIAVTCRADVRAPCGTNPDEFRDLFHISVCCIEKMSV